MNDPEIEGLESQIESLKQKLHALRRERQRQDVPNAKFVTANGMTTLLDLFGDKDDLILIHNMGRSCNYCTLWADGLIGFTRHLQSRAALVMANPDSPEIQREFAASRGWTIPMVTYDGMDFAESMGMYKADGDKSSYWPGVSGFRRSGDRIERTGWAYFEPGDDYCAIWHLFEVLQDGANGWEPRLSYPA